MLKQIVHWLLISGSIADGILLGRFFGLRLHRLYLFLALDCVLRVFYDTATIYLGADSQESIRVHAYARLLTAVLTPLIAWDIFEEAKAQLTQLRRMEGFRMAAALAVIGLSAGMLLILLNFEAESATMLDYIQVIGMFLWGGYTLAAFVFIWKMRRAARKQVIPLPHNTRIWGIYYLFTFASGLVYCTLFFTQAKLTDAAADSIDILFSLYGIVLTLWCAFSIQSAEGKVEPSQKTLSRT